MKKVIISSDSCLDEYKSELKKNNIEYMPMAYILDKEYKDTFDSQQEYDDFYNKMRNGAVPTTSMLNAVEMQEYFENIIKKHNCDIIHISLSSGLSGTYDNTLQGAKTANKNYPNNNIYVIDSLSATQAQNLLVNLAVDYKNENLTAKEIYKNLSEDVKNIQQWVVINDLYHLKRGGRLSSTKAIIGTMLSTKPILTMNQKGKLVMNSKAVGIKKALKLLQEKVTELSAFNDNNNLIYIGHSDSFYEAELLKSLIKKKYENINIKIKNIGPVIGSHTGPGAVCVVFKGKKRIV